MKRLFHGLIGLATLAALLGWLMGRGEGGRVPLAAAERLSVSQVSPVPRVMSASMSAQKSALPSEGREIVDKFAKAEVLASQQTEVKTASGEKLLRRVRLVRDESFKYPVLRVEDEIVRTPQGDRLVRQNAMVGDHVMVKLRNPKMPEAELLKVLGDGGASVRKRMPASGLWLVAFAEPKTDTVPRAISRLSKLEEHVLVVEPDHIMTAQAAATTAPAWAVCAGRSLC
ncbi:hypothetical protein [Brevifollis gellanilyticus]|uniref:Uncharacterized protein n=1 Tax=Brevifollis gellanilyticus TaxID=748831 RepID=A0A512M8W5_9BACT|nr:hypothetical protein [Brevifollis gellanilyticus]GEP43177.1 hypothetical protein BGE01nite_24680 [Brevifollis gellanilyticus]